MFISLPLAVTLQVSRSFNFITMCNSILAAVTLYKISDWYKKRRASLISFNIFLILVFLFSTFSTLYHIEYVYYDNFYRLSGSEYDAIVYLEELIEQSPASLVITSTSYKATKVFLAAPTFFVNNTHMLSSSKSLQRQFLDSNLTELKIRILPYDKLDTMYIFLYKQEIDDISRDSYLYQVISDIDPVYENSDIIIYTLPFKN